MKTKFNPFLRSALAAAALLGSTSLYAAELTLNGTGTVRILASDWADYLGGSTTFNSSNDWGRLYYRGSPTNAGDGQYIHFDLTRLSGLTVSSDASVTLQNANTTWGGSVTDSFIATANGAWTAAGGAALPGTSTIVGTTNPTGDYGSGASVNWGIGSSTFQGYVNNASSFNGLAIIGGASSTLHFTGPTNPYLTVTTNASMTGVVTVSDDTNWAGKYTFTDGVLYVNDSVSGGDVTINSLGTLAVTEGAANRYWGVNSTQVNSGGVLTIEGHSHLRNLTLAGGELAGIRPLGFYGGWALDDPTTVTGGFTSTISAQKVNLDNGNFSVDTGSTLHFTGSIKSGSITKSGSGTMRITSSGMGGTPVNTQSGATVINGGTVEIYGRSADNGGYTSLGTGTVTINDGGTLVAANDWALGNEWNGGNVGTITVNAGGTLTLNSAGGTVRNGLELNGGTVNGTGENADWGGLYLRSSYVTAGGSATSSISVDTALNSTTTMTVDTGSLLNYSGKIHNRIGSNGGITKAGAGTLTLSGTNTYTGPTTVSEGTLEIGGSGGFDANTAGGQVTVDSGATIKISTSANNALAFQGSTPAWQVSGTLNITANNANSIPAAGIVLNNGTLTGTGTETTYGSLLAVNGSVNTITANGATNAISNSNFGIFDGVTLTLDTPQASDALTASTAFFNAASGTTGGLAKTGDGTVTLTGANTYSGNTTVSGGILSLSTDFLANGSTISIAAGAKLALTHGAGDTVDSLFLDGVQVPAGTYGSSAVTAVTLDFVDNDHFDVVGGTGYLIVLNGPPAGSDYETWGFNYGLSAGSEGGDLDNDGMTNFQEYAFGLIPDSGSSVNPITIPLSKSAGTFTYTRRDISLQNPVLTYTVWTSTDLATWTEDTGATSSQTVTGTDGEVQTVQATITPALLTQSKLFIQVRAN